MKTPTKEQIEGYLAWLKKARDAHKDRYASADNLSDRNLHYGGFLAFGTAIIQAENFFKIRS